MPRFKLRRRMMLRGMLGGSLISVGLPPLEAMFNAHGDAHADGTDPPVRFVTFFWADGIGIGRFEPPNTGPGYTLPEELLPLGPVASKCNIITGLQNPSTVAKTHHEGMTVFNGYNYVDQGQLSSDAGGPTIDQLIADRLDGCTPIRAIHMQVSKRISTDGDGGTNAIALSHRDVGGGLVAQVPNFNPQEVWQTLFGEFVGGVDDRAVRESILDAINDDVQRLKPNLGTRDNERLDAHLEGVAELRQKILAETPPCTLPGEPTEDNTDSMGEEPLTSVNQAMADLLAYAFTCDITRVASFMFKRFVSSTVFDEIGATNGHHSNSHAEPPNGVYNTQYDAGVTYQMQRLADLLTTLDGTVELDGTGDTLLDNTIVYASTDCSTGWRHRIARQPIILAGSGRGYLRSPGIHHQAVAWNGSDFNPNATGNTSDVLLTCLQAFDPGAGSVGGGPGQSNTPLTEVVA